MSTTTAHTIADKVNPTPPPSRDLSYLVSAWDRDHQLLQAPARVRARRNRLSALAAPHASVLRVARLVTLRASPSEVFAAVADEIARCLTGDNASVCRFEGDEVVVLALSHLEPGMNNKPVVGEHHTLNGDNIATKVMHTGRPARLDSSELKIAPGSIAARLRETGLRCTVTVALPPGLMAQSPTTPTRDENPYVVGTSEGRMFWFLLRQRWDRRDRSICRRGAARCAWRSQVCWRCWRFIS